MTESEFHTDDLHTLGATVNNLEPTEICSPGIVDFRRQTLDIKRLTVMHGVTVARHLFSSNVHRNTTLVFKTGKEMTLYI